LNIAPQSLIVLGMVISTTMQKLADIAKQI